MGKRLILLGGGHAHMVTQANIRTLRSQGHEVTVGQTDEYHHYYYGMDPACWIIHLESANVLRAENYITGGT